MVKSLRNRGYTLMEVVVAMAIFGMFLFILVLLTAEMNAYEKKYPVNFMVHPQVIAVLARLRTDVIDQIGDDLYPMEYKQWTQSDKVLIVYAIQQTGFGQTIVWDFRTPGQVTRYSYSQEMEIGRWTARGLPNFKIKSLDREGFSNYGVRIQAFDEKGRLAVDQMYFPRVHG